MPINFSNSYYDLGQKFSDQTLPVPVAQPSLLLWNNTLAQTLAIPFNEDKDADLLAQYFSGNRIFPTSKPIAQAYSGHQFGHFNPQLGDGRAHLLGDITDIQGKTWDIQLKGSGVSHFSRRGDGRCAVGPALREFIMSEAMFALGVPTTRCLAVVATGEDVYREQALAGAIVTRVAESHIRVGTFQYFAARKDVISLGKLTNYAIKRHFPALLPEISARENVSNDGEISSERVLRFFSAVLAKQIPLVLSWLRVGFIHGVMNTDNMTISGETIDYGPCAMMNTYHAETVFSSIDRNHRYAFGKQISIIQWNMMRLAETLLPLIACDDDDGVEKIKPLLAKFHHDLEQGYLTMMAAKIGLKNKGSGVEQLINNLLAIMQKQKLDYTQTFTALTESLHNTIKASSVSEPLLTILADWLPDWYRCLGEDHRAGYQLMRSNNPVVIPRNHHVEAILAISQETSDLSALNKFLTVLRQPYSTLAETADYQDPPVDSDDNYHTFCGT